MPGRTWSYIPVIPAPPYRLREGRPALPVVACVCEGMLSLRDNGKVRNARQPTAVRVCLRRTSPPRAARSAHPRRDRTPIIRHESSAFGRERLDGEDTVTMLPGVAPRCAPAIQ